MNIGGRSYTNFQNVNLKGLQQTAQVGSAMLRFEGGGTTANFAGTMTVNTTYIDADKAWTLPAKSGTFPISGTFSVDFPLVSATTYVTSTIVTVAGIRTEDGVTVTPNMTGATCSTCRILFGAVPGDGTITLYFANIGSAAYALAAQVFSYTAVR